MLEVKIENIEVLACIVVSYVECLTCGMAWQTPRMDDAELEYYYSSGLYRRQLNQSQTVLDTDERIRSERIFDTLQTLGVNGSILDIGCSRGYLLQMFAERGAEVMGVEENSGYVLPGVPHMSSLTHLHTQYDIITMIHVLEHVAQPRLFLQEVVQYLKPGGTLLIEVPSKSSKGGPYRLAHLTYMTEATLTALCERAGLTVLSISTIEHTQILCTKQI